MTEDTRKPSADDALDRYLRIDADAGDADSGAQRPPAHDHATSSAELDLYARCDAAMALAPKLRNTAGLDWAFAEARRIARSAPGPAQPATTPAWHKRPDLAWGVAAAMACLALVLGITSSPPDAPDAVADDVPTSSFTFAPIIVPGVTAEQLRRLADVEPVVLVADQVAVDGRSLAVLPFTTTADDSGLARTADALYQQLMQQLTAVPGVYVLDPGLTAAVAGSDMTRERVAQYLGVRGIVEGHLAGDRQNIRLDLSFTDAALAENSVARAFEAPTTELGTIQAAMAGSVLDALSAPAGFADPFTAPDI